MEGVSVAELIRRGVDRVLAGREEPGIAERRRRALAVVGSFSGDTGDVSLRHDDYFVEAATAKR